jgi:hypothetical protein
MAERSAAQTAGGGERAVVASGSPETPGVPGTSHRRALQRSRMLLQQIGRDISGVVLNKVERRPGYGYYYGYYHYHYYADQQSEEDTAGQTEQS